MKPAKPGPAKTYDDEISQRQFGRNAAIAAAATLTVRSGPTFCFSHRLSRFVHDDSDVCVPGLSRIRFLGRSAGL